MTNECYHYRQCGLDNVHLLNGFTIKKTKHGVTMSIQDMDGLHQAIGTYLVRKKRT